ncbi:acyltransferase [Chromobacterium sphagni]|uniref:Acyltransferase n=1 Tax=Chromobacterium sphagni TaxID=1903179 RepID=A0A1S1WU56_9NEIS|nr:acyltransferase [Chromobacterium sphagni]OHX10758.1 acyltransferase [Chromobacterium sphagni]OHX16353.1 acyltransferase [Chromobacterium sphagni]
MSQARHWAGIGENTFIAGIVLLFWIHRLLGRRLFRLCLLPVVACYWLSGGAARAASLQYLQRLETHCGALGRQPGRLDTFRHLLRFADTMLDKLLATAGRYPAGQVDICGADVVIEGLRQQRGALIVTAHIGCLELCRALADQSPEVVVNVLVHTRHAQRFNALLNRLNPQQSIRLLEVTEVNAATAVLLEQKIAAGEVVAIAGDRIPVHGDRIVTVPFLGEAAPFPSGPYLLAHLLRCPLYLMACVRNNRGYRLQFVPLAESIRLPRQNREAVIAEHASRFAGELACLLAASPYDWFNFFPFWEQKSKQ